MTGRTRGRYHYIQKKISDEISNSLDKGLYSQSHGFSSSHVWMWELDHKESWAPKNWCFWSVLEKTLESPLDCKEIKPVNPKGNQSWIFIGRTDAEAPILWPPDVRSWLIRKDPNAGKDWRQEEKGTTGWDGCMASLSQRTWVSASSGKWWRTEKPGVLQLITSQRVGRDWPTEHHHHQDFPGGPMVRNLPANVGDTGSINVPGGFHVPGATQPSSGNYWAHTPWPLKSEPVLCNRRSPHTTTRQNLSTAPKIKHSHTC